MKPNFALSLSFEGIRLLHRAAGGWRVVGEVAVDAADLSAELAVLRRTATALDPNDLRTKLLLPDAQIKYLTIDTPDMDDDARRDAARSALDEATPYPVDDLAFDISVDGPLTHIAAVARETLAEAEGFAAEHHFNPISFAAVPDETPYLGEPFFGPTKAGLAALEEGETIEADGIAVVIIGDATPQDTAGPSVETPDTDTPVQDQLGLAIDDALAAEETGANEEDIQDTTSEAKETLDVTDDIEPETLEVTPETSKPDGTDAEAETDVVKADEAEAKDAAEAEDQTDVAKAEEAEAEDAADTEDETDVVKADEAEAEDAAEAEEKTVVSGSKETTQPSADDTDSASEPVKKRLTLGAAQNIAVGAAPPVAAPSVGFATRRAAETTAAPSRIEPSVTSPDLPGAETPAPPIAADAVTQPPMPVPLKPLPVQDPEPVAARTTPLAAASAAAAPIGRFLSRRKAKTNAVAAAVQPAMAAAVAAPRNEAERMTIFGARRSDVGGKPRFLGLMLTAALLVFLAGVAAWASVFLDEGLNLSRIFGDRTARETALAAPQTQPPQSQQPEPEAPVENVVTASLDPTLTPEDTAVLDALRETVPVQSNALTERELEALYATSGIWPRGPDVPPEPAGLVNIDDLYLTSIDPVTTSNDAVALPAFASFGTDIPLDTLASPAAAGTAFAMDARGLIIPTAQGALSPDGITIFLGRPPVVPPVTRARFQPVPQDDGVRAALAKERPKQRPKGLADSNERAQLDGLTRRELAGLRPELRPRSIQERAAAEKAKEDAAAKEAADAARAAQTANDTGEAVEAALAAANTVPTTNTFNNPTRLATKASARPDTRPRNFSRIVKRAQRTPQPKAEQETRVASVASVAPRTVKPKVPSKTSVARQATVKNAINLRKVNLIGVYGKPSNRRALVRLSNGRYKKVTVGDRIDGGRVAAIGNSELRYTKGGRSVVLKMPR